MFTDNCLKCNKEIKKEFNITGSVSFCNKCSDNLKVYASNDREKINEFFKNAMEEDKSKQWIDRRKYER